MTTQNQAAIKWYRSGFVNRYHSHPDFNLRNSNDLTDGHSNRMVKLGAYIFPNLMDGNFALCLAFHDGGETDSGDSPHHAKNANPALRQAGKEIEEAYMDSVEELCGDAFSFSWMNEEQEKAQKILDRLESFLYQCFVSPYRMRSEKPLAENILELASELKTEDAYDKIEGLITEGLNHARTMSQGWDWSYDNVH